MVQRVDANPFDLYDHPLTLPRIRCGGFRAAGAKSAEQAVARRRRLVGDERVELVTFSVQDEDPTQPNDVIQVNGTDRRE